MKMTHNANWDALGFSEFQIHARSLIGDPARHGKQGLARRWFNDMPMWSVVARPSLINIQRCLLEIQKPVWGANWRPVKPPSQGCSAAAAAYVNPDHGYHYVLLILARSEKWTLLVYYHYKDGPEILALSRPRQDRKLPVSKNYDVSQAARH